MDDLSLRRIFINCIIDTSRKATINCDIDDFLNRKTNFSSELEADHFLAYEKALDKISDNDKEAVILRIEFGMTYNQIASELDKPSEDAARMQVNRALINLSRYI